MMKKSNHIFIIVSLALSLSACGEKESTKDQKEKVAPVEEILSDVVIDEDLGISYKTPLSWELMSSELSERYVARLDNEQFDGNFIVYHPKAFYFNSNISGLLRIGSVVKNNDVDDMELNIDNYIARFRKFNPIKEFERKSIRTDNMVITQLIIEKSDLISFKNIFRNEQNKIIQFDYSIRKKDYEDEIEKINSALASIELL